MQQVFQRSHTHAAHRNFGSAAAVPLTDAGRTVAAAAQRQATGTITEEFEHEDDGVREPGDGSDDPCGC